MNIIMRRAWLIRGLPTAIVLLLLASVSLRAQDAGQVLGTSVRFGTLKNSVEMTDEVRTEVDKLQRLAGEANAARRYGDALKHLYHGIALMQKQPWSPARALSGAMTGPAARAEDAPRRACSACPEVLGTGWSGKQGTLGARGEPAVRARRDEADQRGMMV